MSSAPTVEEERLIADSFERGRAQMTDAELRSGVLACAAFFAWVAGLWAIAPPHSFAVVPALVCLFTLVLASLVRIDTPFGFTVPTQLAFVPLLFAMPVALVPIAVALALVIASLTRVINNALRPSRLLQMAPNAAFALGPATVLAIANVEPRHAGPAILIAALAAQLVVDFAFSSARFVLIRGVDIPVLLRSTWVYAFDVALSGIALVVAEDIHSAPVAALALIPLLGLLGVFARERHERLQSMLELSSAYRGTALVLGDVIEADDGYTGEHCKSVVGLALEVSEHLGLTAEQRRNLEFAALLHDVGKIAIPKEIINKPGKLDPHEWTIIKTHTLEGQKMLERVGGFMREVGIIVRSHHERWDGGGYPDGLAGEAIPLEARIITCCDTWNAMRTDRPYRKALSHDIALAELVSNAGGQFDPRVVETFVRLLAPATEAESGTGNVAEPARAPAQLIAGAAEI